MTRRAKPLSRERMEAIAARYGAGESVADLARDLGLGIQAIYRALKTIGVARRGLGGRGRNRLEGAAADAAVATLAGAKSLKAAARELGVGRATLREFCEKRGIAPPKGDRGSSPKISAEKRAACLEGFRRGDQLTRIAAETGVSTTQISRMAHEAGLPPRPTGRARGVEVPAWVPVELAAVYRQKAAREGEFAAARWCRREKQEMRERAAATQGNAAE